MTSSDPIPSREENPTGLHGRYFIEKVDGSPIDPRAEYFTLRLDEYGNDKVHIAACRRAIHEYAGRIHFHLPQLAYDLIGRYPLLDPPSISAQPLSQENNEAVNHPNHYGGEHNPYEAIKVIGAWELGFSLGNAVKYISRAGKKNPDKTIEDLEKARWYLDHQINRLKEGHKL